MLRRHPEPSPWDHTCPGFRRAIAEAVATGELPRWVARHLDRCAACRRGLAHVVGRATPLSEAGQGLAEQVAFVARVRGLARDIARERRRSVIRHIASRRLDRWRVRLQADWRLPAAMALLLALASAGLAVWLIVTGPSLSSIPPLSP
jgi:hypothetical protein